MNGIKTKYDVLKVKTFLLILSSNLFFYMIFILLSANKDSSVSSDKQIILKENYSFIVLPLTTFIPINNAENRALIVDQNNKLIANDVYISKTKPLEMNEENVWDKEQVEKSDKYLVQIKNQDFKKIITAINQNKILKAFPYQDNFEEFKKVRKINQGWVNEINF